MSAKHTPGPWRVVGPYIASDSERVVAKFCDNNTAGPVWAGTPADPMTTANGRLLAAAPVILEALKAAYSILLFRGELLGLDDRGPVMDEIRAAIVAAEGSAPDDTPDR